MRISGCVFCFILLACALPCQAQESEAEQKLLELLNFDTFSAAFAQRLFSERLEIIESSRGLVWISRPRMFRWEYSSPTQQILVSNGQELINYDPDLKQASVSPLADAMGHLPMILLLGKGVPREYYSVQFQSRSDGLDWLILSPRGGDSDFVRLRLAYRGKAIKRMELIDQLSQKSVIDFFAQKFDRTIDPSVFRLYLPPDVDVAGGFSVPQQSTPH